MHKSSAILLASWFFLAAAQAQGFSFSGEEAKERNAQAAEENQRDAYVQYELATPCKKAIKNQKIMVLVGENTQGTVSARQGAFGEHVDAINKRLQMLGLRTFSSAQIRQQVAQAEIDAYFRNDPDAALNASRKMAAQYTLRGVIVSRAERNPMMETWTGVLMGPKVAAQVTGIAAVLPYSQLRPTLDSLLPELASLHYDNWLHGFETEPLTLPPAASMRSFASSRVSGFSLPWEWPCRSMDFLPIWFQVRNG